LECVGGNCAVSIVNTLPVYIHLVPERDLECAGGNCSFYLYCV